MAIERMLKPVDEHVALARDTHGANALKLRIAVYGSFAANVSLAVIQVFAAVSSGSLSLFTTMADALFDPLSNLNLLICHRAVERVNAHKFPSGKARIETAGNIVFCFLMSSVNMILIAMSIMQLQQGFATDPNKKPEGLHVPSIAAVSVAFSTKLLLFLCCWPLRRAYSNINILWEDHRNDLFINGFGILTSAGGGTLRWWIDPAGAIALSVLVITLWMYTAYGEFLLLIGKAADQELHQWITYICEFRLPDFFFSFFFSLGYWGFGFGANSAPTRAFLPLFLLPVF
jgi:divalent metal cation (Fe/Co/Zn/Cd) transporter